MKTAPALLTILASLAAFTPLRAGDAHAAPIAKDAEKESSLFDRIWALPTIYENKESDFLNSFRFVGRFDGDIFQVNSDLGYNQNWVVRRLRAGAVIQAFHHLTAKVEVDFQPQTPDPFYSRLTDAYLAWEFSKAATVIVGKQSANFTLDGSTSSTQLLTIDRNNLSNNLWFTDQYIPGVSLRGTPGQWVYNVGFFSGGSESPEFGNFDAGYFGIGSIGYDFAKNLGVKKALVRADFVHNERNLQSTFTSRLENIGALVFVFDHTPWGCSADLALASGYGGQSNLFGANIMPWVNITKNLQLVGRYTYVSSEDPQGVRFARYENTLTSARGDEYNEIYGGLNYYIYGHKLKLQTGFAYVTMKGMPAATGDYNGWSWTSSIRINF
jgi:phosphate-selective porin OprO/OprP